MSLAQQAAEDIKTFANRIKPFMDVARALEELGSLDQQIDEANNRKRDAAAMYEKQSKELKELLDKVSFAEENLQKLELKSENIITDAEEHSAEIIEKAHLKAAEIMSQAQKLQGELDDSMAQRRADSFKLDNEIAEKQKTLHAIKAEIAAMKSKFQEKF